MKSRIAVAVVALALAGATAADAQIQPPQERINTALARARQTGIPVTLLESKIAEGKAKGVPLERIAVAIDRRLSALERANQALRGQADAAASLAVAADAIESGVNEAVLRDVAESAPGTRRNVAIATLTELVHQGHTPQAALGRVKDAIKKGPDALTNLPAQAAPRSRGGGSANGQGQGNAGGRAGAEPGPPAGVPAPGKPPQAEKPGGPVTDRGAGPPADRGGGNPTNPGRGGR
jgi:hypothetical protein